MLGPYLAGMPLKCQKGSLERASRPMLYANRTDRGFGVATGALVSRSLPTDVSEHATIQACIFFLPRHVQIPCSKPSGRLEYY